MFKQAQKIGKAFMLPIAILPAAGLLLGIGGALSNPATLASYPILDQPVLQGIFGVMTASGAVVFSNLPMLLAIGLCIGLAKRDKGTAALAGLVGYLVMNATIGAMLAAFSSEAEPLPIDTGVIGALAIGGVAVWIHNRYYNIQLPAFLGFFGGSRFVPIATSFAAMGVGMAFYLIWPPIQNALVSMGESIASMGLVGTFLYGFILRLTGAVGLHHTIYPLFWYTPLGGVEMVNGETIEGAQKIFFAQLADPNHTGLFTEGTRFFAGRFATMMFGLPGACLAMWRWIPAPNRAKYTGLFASVALTSFLTGITEPIEFMFLFIAPWLYVIHAFFDGISFMLADLLNIRIGNTFSGGFIDFTLFGILQGNARTNWLLVLPIGVLWFFLYYFTFRFLIRRFNVGTPGRFEDESDSPANGDQAVTAGEASDAGSSTDSPLRRESIAIIAALGGEANIQDVDACITRLRVSVHDAALVDKDLLKKMGATAVLEVSGGVQAVYGAKAILYKSEIGELLGMEV